jgi:predicted  nucleic acid-binding Zn-ribbon protein
LAESIRAAESTLPEAVKAVYRRLVQAHGAGALAAVENNACSACHAILAPQERVQIKTQQHIFCRSCGRLLYSSE